LRIGGDSSESHARTIRAEPAPAGTQRDISSIHSGSMAAEDSMQASAIVLEEARSLAARAILVSLVGLTLAVVAPALRSPATVVVDDDHDGIDDVLEQKLAERWAPIIFIEPDESNYAVNVEWFLARAHLQYHEDCGLDVDDDIGPNPLESQANLLGPPWAGGPNCGEDDSGYSHPPHHRLTAIAADPDGQTSAGGATTGYSDQQTFVIPDLDDSVHVGSTDPSEWRTYFHVYPAEDGGVMIQYWHVFAYNELAVGSLGNHGGDWDASIQVKLNRLLELEGVWFSRHDHDHPGDFFGRGNARLTVHGTHPLMSIDGGGHAAFADVFDFCDHSAPVVSTTIAYPADPNDPTNPAKLDIATSDPTGCGVHLEIPGGIVWETWTGGRVRASGSLEHPLTSNDSPHGGLSNLGEYNPCTPTTCNGSAQASTLLAGEFHPLNANVFIRYEGKWGSLPHIQGFVGQPPRGPVFQGFEDRGEGNVSVYTAWYNQAANAPAADDGTHPWLVPPSTTAALIGPSFSDGTVRYVSGATRVSLEASQSAIADAFGPATTYVRLFRSGTPPYEQYAGPFTLPAPDGFWEVEYYSVDGLDNVEAPPHGLPLTLDTTAPTVAINEPTATSYPHSATLTLAYSASDGGSGIESVDAEMDAAATLAGHGLASGQAISLLTELGVGDHTFAVKAIDHVANPAPRSVTFSIIVTPESIIDDVSQFLGAGKIKNRGMANSLTAKLSAAAAARARGNCATAANLYSAFQHELEAQSGKGVEAAAASIMVGDAQYLIGHCP
jgi:hypothetical protein